MGDSPISNDAALVDRGGIGAARAFRSSLLRQVPASRRNVWPCCISRFILTGTLSHWRITQVIPEQRAATIQRPSRSSTKARRASEGDPEWIAQSHIRAMQVWPFQLTPGTSDIARGCCIIQSRQGEAAWTANTLKERPIRPKER